MSHFSNQNTHHAQNENYVQLSLFQNMPDVYFEKSAEIQQALERWQQAQAYFESVDDPELIDFASYQLEAARRCYTFLVKREKERQKLSISLN